MATFRQILMKLGYFLFYHLVTLHGSLATIFRLNLIVDCSASSLPSVRSFVRRCAANMMITDHSLSVSFSVSRQQICLALWLISMVKAKCGLIGLQIQLGSVAEVF